MPSPLVKLLQKLTASKNSGPKRSGQKKKKSGSKRQYNRQKSTLTQQGYDIDCALRNVSNCGYNPSCHVSAGRCVRRMGAASGEMVYQGPIMPLNLPTEVIEIVSSPSAPTTPVQVPVAAVSAVQALTEASKTPTDEQKVIVSVPPPPPSGASASASALGSEVLALVPAKGADAAKELIELASNPLPGEKTADLEVPLQVAKFLGFAFRKRKSGQKRKSGKKSKSGQKRKSGHKRR